MIGRRLRSFRGCTRGAAAVEFAIISVALIMLLIGIVELGRVLYVKNQISYLADRAVRQVLLQPDVSESKLAEDLRADFSAGDPAALTISVVAQSTATTDYRLIEVGFPVTLFIPFLESNSLSLSVTRRVPTG